MYSYPNQYAKAGLYRHANTMRRSIWVPFHSMLTERRPMGLIFFKHGIAYHVTNGTPSISTYISKSTRLCECHNPVHVTVSSKGIFSADTSSVASADTGIPHPPTPPGGGTDYMTLSGGVPLARVTFSAQISVAKGMFLANLRRRGYTFGNFGKKDP